MMNGKVPFFFSSESLGYFTIGRPADNVMTTQEDTTGLLQKTSVWTMSRPGVKKVMNSYFIASWPWASSLLLHCLLVKARSELF